MKRKSLSSEDCRAIDLILNHGAAHRSGPSQVTGEACHSRVMAASKLLSLLDTLPAAEPPSDLVARTMNRISTGAQPVITAPAVVSATAALH